MPVLLVLRVHKDQLGLLAQEDLPVQLVLPVLRGQLVRLVLREFRVVDLVVDHKAKLELLDLRALPVRKD